MRSLQEEQRRARSAAFGVGTAFAGAGLIAFPISTHVATLLFLAGFGVSTWMFYGSLAVERRAKRGSDHGREANAVTFALADIATTLADLHREAAATEGVLQRVRSRQ